MEWSMISIKEQTTTSISVNVVKGATLGKGLAVFSCALEFDESTCQFAQMPFLPVLTNSLFKYITAYFILDLNARWGYSGSGDDNNVGLSYTSWFSCALDFDE
ncbi:hypothetical protein HZH66_001643 [Vespula vulgaris]|uniref:Uncharacterized protein n=1 Tax=Vespula vulgaris TaxID=7454 RepID=A0A834KTU3_VESVU|nr:hypothetical protein HZH66_001643 [Vespula vulgaris]